jgi:hypothetical protein
MSRYYGTYRATIVDSMDPTGLKRVRVSCPSLGGQFDWAMPCLPPGAHAGTNGYAVGDKVWITLEVGDPSLPVVLGKFL